MSHLVRKPRQARNLAFLVLLACLVWSGAQPQAMTNAYCDNDECCTNFSTGCLSVEEYYYYNCSDVCPPQCVGERTWQGSSCSGGCCYIRCQCGLGLAG